jgi:hypothetical protein
MYARWMVMMNKRVLVLLSNVSSGDSVKKSSARQVRRSWHTTNWRRSIHGGRVGLNQDPFSDHRITAGHESVTRFDDIFSHQTYEHLKRAD